MPKANIALSSAVAPRNHVQMRSSRFYGGRLRQANIGQQPIIKFEKLPVMLSIQPHCYSGQPRDRNFPGLSDRRRTG
jgi:hypothetical protein